LVFITVVESVYSAVRTDSLYKADYVSFLKDECSRAKFDARTKPLSLAWRYWNDARDTVPDLHKWKFLKVITFVEYNIARHGLG
jgi:hypothetical protein